MVWKPMLALVIAEWSLTDVLFCFFYGLYLWKTKKKRENNLTIITKLNTLQAKSKIHNSDHYIALGIIPEMDFDVIL